MRSYLHPMDNIVIHKSKVSGTNIVCFSAWVPSSYTGPHATLMTIDGVVHGKVGTERIPAEIDALPAYSMERSNAVGRWYANQKLLAYQAIVTKHPEARDGVMDGMGEIELIEQEKAA